MGVWVKKGVPGKIAKTMLSTDTYLHHLITQHYPIHQLSPVPQLHRRVAHLLQH